MNRALLIIDVQNDFCPGGSLAVPDGDKVVPFINRYIRLFKRRRLPIIASRDWHPARTSHFKRYGGPWPVHCLHNTSGAFFHPKLCLPNDTIVISKGMDPRKESYSAFQAIDTEGRGLHTILQAFGIRELYLAGLATDYCVKYSALDALKKKYQTIVLTDAIRGVDMRPDDSVRALRLLALRGAKLKTRARIPWLK